LYDRSECQNAGVAQADRLAVLLDVGDDQDLRMARQLELAQHVDLQRAEAAAEGDLLGRRDALVAEHQHVVVEVGAVDAREVASKGRTSKCWARLWPLVRGQERLSCRECRGRCALFPNELLVASL
jgi:hypothetical protein